MPTKASCYPLSKVVGKQDFRFFLLQFTAAVTARTILIRLPDCVTLIKNTGTWGRRKEFSLKAAKDFERVMY